LFQGNAPPLRVILKQVQDDEWGGQHDERVGQGDEWVVEYDERVGQHDGFENHHGERTIHEHSCLTVTLNLFQGLTSSTSQHGKTTVANVVQKNSLPESLTCHKKTLSGHR
jgi:hypothetical protein